MCIPVLQKWKITNSPQDSSAFNTLHTLINAKTVNAYNSYLASIQNSLETDLT